MRRDIGNNLLDALHHAGEIDSDVFGVYTEFVAAPHQGGDPGRADHRLRRHTAGVEAVAAHAVFFDQGDLGAYRGRDLGRDQPGRAGADDDHITVEMARLRVATQRLARLNMLDGLARDQRKQTQQDERRDQPRR